MARKKPNNLTETTNTINAFIIGIIGSLVALAMFFLSGYMVTQSALGAPLYALMVLVYYNCNH
jgi:ATP-binding cassette subfamily C protein CydC